MKLLLHTCCGPCLVYPFTTIKKNNKFKPTAYFYNPNIHPYEEFTNRLNSLSKYCKNENIDIILHDSYEPHKYVEKIEKKLHERCTKCYELRLMETAEYAKKNGFEAFTTTLLVSPYQKHDVVKKVGEDISKKVGIMFYYEDWRSGYIQGRKKAKEHELYSQKYCGCFYSEFERKMDRKNKK